MTLDRECRGTETINGVTIGAFAFRFRFGELPVMVVVMAIQASIMFEAGFGLAGEMALLAGYCDMLT
jgi:hypothetical protein